MIINIVLIMVIIAGLAGIVLCLREEKKTQKKADQNKKNQSKTTPKVKSNSLPLAFALLFVITLCTTVIVIRTASQKDSAEQSSSDELFSSRISGLMLGKHLARTCPGYNALIVIHDKDSANTLLDATLDGLREGLAGKVKIAAMDSPISPATSNKSPGAGKSNISPERMLYLSRKMQSNNFDQLISRHPECNLIISLIGLPKDAEKMLIMRQNPEKRPKIALLSGNISTMKESINRGEISAAIISRPDYVPGKKKLPRNIDSAFDMRFLLVTPDNVKTVALDFPEIFKQRPPPPDSPIPGKSSK